MIIGGMNPNDTVAGVGPAAGLQASALPGTPLPTGATLLADWGLIRARGEDAATFLQGQLTNDLLSLPAGQARLAGFCSPKGRLLASFIVWKDEGEDWLLACSADLLPAALKRLSMFVLRAKCQLSDASSELALWGLAGDSARTWLNPDADGAEMSLRLSEGRRVLRLSDVQGQPRWLLVQPAAEPAPALAELPAAQWRWLEVASATPRIVAATVEAFVPQMVNFELVGGVSFKKGCYPGQEVVARSQYRGTLKRRGALLSGPAAMQPGDEIFDAADPGQPAGTVALAAPGPDGQHLAFVELKLAALEGGQLHLAAADGPALQAHALPYKLPQDAQ